MLLESHFFRIPAKDEKYSINWRSNIVAVITGDTVDEGNSKRQNDLS